ncbi:MAG: NAD(+) synthase [Clostridia bacterium]|jgi:NAD+ synthase|nr:NAD(+) synthase [Clostridia bacterium]
METRAESVDQIVGWMKRKVQEAGAVGVVFGLSGGLDSAVVAALAVRAFGKSALGLIMPCYSEAEDVSHGELVAQAFKLPYKIIDLGPVYDLLIETMTRAMPDDGDAAEMARLNLKPRLRMATLYYVAACHNCLVLGTGNKSEIMTGYFTKYGDGGVDLEPIGHLLKSQVKELAYYLHVPEDIILKAPSAGLAAGQTDEKELGLKYAELDHYLQTGQADPAIKERIEYLRKKSEHKRFPPPTPLDA